MGDNRVGHRAGPGPGFIGRPGWDQLQRLDLALFVDTEDQGLVGRVDIQADDVGELLDEPRVGRQFERPDESSPFLVGTLRSS